MHSPEEAMEEDCMEEDCIGEEGGKQHREQEEGTEEKKEIRPIEGKLKWVQGETQMQWIQTEEEEGTGHAMYVGSGAIWPKIVGKGIKEEYITNGHLLICDCLI